MSEQENVTLPETVEVIGVRFKADGKVYYFDPKGVSVTVGQNVIVETARGSEFGVVASANAKIPVGDAVLPLKPLVRIATKIDERINEANKAKEKEALKICQQKIAAHKLEMKLVDAEYTFDNGKLLFYFTADGRVDFRELVKDLASTFRTRIELRQIGIRDEAKFIGGFGICGRPFCCSTFLTDLNQISVTIKMAKEQNLSLNAAKISGTCGRLMCCLRYEHEAYVEEIKLTPPVGSRVRTADGIGNIVETSPLTGMLKVVIEAENGDRQFKSYHRDDVTVLASGKRAPRGPKTEDEDEIEPDDGSVISDSEPEQSSDSPSSEPSSSRRRHSRRFFEKKLGKKL